jgi:hypothetical protein
MRSRSTYWSTMRSLARSLLWRQKRQLLLPGYAAGDKWVLNGTNTRIASRDIREDETGWSYSSVSRQLVIDEEMEFDEATLDRLIATD